MLLKQKDIADLAIEDLRKWERWDIADQVLDLYAQASHDVPIIRPPILVGPIHSQSTPSFSGKVSFVRLRSRTSV